MSIQTIRVVFVGTFPASSGGGSSNVSVIDLGIINISDVYRAGVIELIPYLEGKRIKSVFFDFDGVTFAEDDSHPLLFVTPNTSFAGYGIAIFDGQIQGDHNTDDLAIQGNLTSVDGNTGPSGILDTSPLYVVPLAYPPLAPISHIPLPDWAASTSYNAFVDAVLDPNGKIRAVDGVSGISGNDPDVFDDPGPVTDGTTQWTEAVDPDDIAGSIHVFAEVVDGMSPLPKPDSIVLVTQPTDTVSGQNITPSPQLKILDQFGEPYLFTSLADTNLSVLAVVRGNDSNVQIGLNSADPDTGVMTLDNFTVTADPGTYTIRVFLDVGVGVSPVDSDPFDVT